MEALKREKVQIEVKQICFDLKNALREKEQSARMENPGEDRQLLEALLVEILKYKRQKETGLDCERVQHRAAEWFILRGVLDACESSGV